MVGLEGSSSQVGGCFRVKRVSDRGGGVKLGDDIHGLLWAVHSELGLPSVDEANQWHLCKLEHSFDMLRIKGEGTGTHLHCLCMEAQLHHENVDTKYCVRSL